MAYPGCSEEGGRQYTCTKVKVIPINSETIMHPQAVCLVCYLTVYCSLLLSCYLAVARCHSLLPSVACFCFLLLAIQCYYVLVKTECTTHTIEMLWGLMYNNTLVMNCHTKFYSGHTYTVLHSKRVEQQMLVLTLTGPIAIVSNLSEISMM